MWHLKSWVKWHFRNFCTLLQLWWRKKVGISHDILWEYTSKLCLSFDVSLYYKQRGLVPVFLPTITFNYYDFLNNSFLFLKVWENTFRKIKFQRILKLPMTLLRSLKNEVNVLGNNKSIVMFHAPCVKNIWDSLRAVLSSRRSINEQVKTGKCSGLYDVCKAPDLNWDCR